MSAIAMAALVLAGGSAAVAVAGASPAPQAEASTFTGTAAVQKPDAEKSTPAPRPARTVKAAPSATPTPTPEYREEVVVESIAFAESTVDDADLPAGQTRVVTEGSPGERTITYRVTEIDGTETERSVVSDVVSTPPVDRVIANGTYVAPPPPPAPAPVAGSAGGGCDSNYAEACVPIDSDVDCAGGSGNGPSYFGGVARIVGTDVYDLDRDGDGYACEPS
ncbi:G5 domain-containing protein [Microbacterium phosphatis]